MTFRSDDPNTWPYFGPLIIAHDVGRRRDRSTAVIGGKSPVQPRLLGIKELTAAGPLWKQSSQRTGDD